VAGPEIQATKRSEFEDDLGSGDFVSGYSYGFVFILSPMHLGHVSEFSFGSAS
jgi:hypothetical protein